MNRRTLLLSAGGLAATGGVAATGALAAGESLLGGGPTTTDAVVEAKSITGRRADTRSGLLLAHRGTLSVDSEALTGEFESWRDVTVGDDLHDRLRFDYLDIQFNLHLRTAERGRGDSTGTAEGPNASEGSNASGSAPVTAYEASRADFNAAQVGGRASARLTDDRVPRVASLSVIDD
jgi:hypothetical protein